LLAGDTWLVNFQLAGAPTPTRYLPDTGLVFGDRGGGVFYGWSGDHTDVSRDRGIHPDQRLDTLIHFHQGQTWEFALPNGLYEVTVSIGDAAFDSTYTLNVEGVNFWNAVYLPPGDFRSHTQQITVSDGRLTLDQGTASEKATRIDYIHIVGLPSGPNAAPATPTITEPAMPGMTLNPQDVHMEAGGYFDPDGDAHKSSDWQIWTTGAGSQPVWQTLGITGLERLHTHLGDGNFINSHAGRTSLLPNTAYELRVRFRDETGSVSSFAIQPFQTGAASAIFPLELQDIASLPTSYWVTTTGSNLVLPVATPLPHELRLESPDGSLLLRIGSFNGTVNSVTNPPALSTHVSVRAIIRAGSTALNLPASNVRVNDDSGTTHTIYLPAVSLAAGQRLDLWVASSGSTYYGTAMQTEPDFSSLARASDISFTAMQPGFVVEEVGGGYRLPVNITFVPDPGPNPTDPLYYVTELYGSIQVVQRNGVRHTFATGLLDYNPEGPISGTGEQGLTGIVVRRNPSNPEIYQLFVGMLWDNGSPPLPGNPVHYPKVERIDSAPGGLTMASRTVLLNMQPETQGQSHQISNITIGPDGKLYVHNGDGFDYTTAQNLNQFRGKVLRMNLDGTAPTDNPFYNASDGITARDYVFAYGLRNPFGGAWRASDLTHYQVENGPSIDRFSKILRGVNYGWNNTNQSMTINAIYNWSPAVAPVNITFVQPETFAGSQFPAGKMDRAFVSESGPTYATGPQANGKRLVEFVLDANGNRIGGPTTLVQYTDVGKGTVVGLAAGPDGLYFTELYEDSGANGATAAGARIFRVRYVNPIAADYDINGIVNANDHTVWRTNFGSNLLLASDGNRNGVVEAADYVLWRKQVGSGAGHATSDEQFESGQHAQSATAHDHGPTAWEVGLGILASQDTSSTAPRSPEHRFSKTDVAPFAASTHPRVHDVALLAVLAELDALAAHFSSDTQAAPNDRTPSSSPLPDFQNFASTLDLRECCLRTAKIGKR